MSKSGKAAKAVSSKAGPLDSANGSSPTAVAAVKANSIQRATVDPLTPAETKLLAQCEEVIRKGLKSFKEVFDALLPVYEQRLYRAEFATFEDYCRTKWDISARHANRLISAGGVVANLKSDQLVLSEPVAIPENEAQARPLAGLKAEEQVKAAQIVAKKPGKHTTKDFVAAAEEVVGKKGKGVNTDTASDEEEEKPRVKAYDPREDNPKPVKSITAKANLETLMAMVDEAQTQARRTEGCSDVAKMLSDAAKIINQRLNGGLQMKISEAKKHYVDVPKKTNFHIPEGKYRAKIVGINDVLPEKSHVTGKTKKFVFEVEVPSLPKTRNLATAEYLEDLDDDTELHKVVSRLLGPKVIEDSAGGKLDIGGLEGKDVDVEIAHITTNRSHEYDYPLVKVCGVYLAGTLVKPPVIKQPDQNQPTKAGESIANN